MNNIAKRIALTGAFAALVVVLGITKLGFIPLGAASVTILHVPVILITMLSVTWETKEKTVKQFFSGLIEGCIVGAAFGILSLVQAAMAPSGGLDPLFVNPLISVLPRVLLGVAAWVLWKALNLIPKMPRIVSAGVTAFLATLMHTVMVIGALYLFAPGMDEIMGGGYGVVIIALLPQACLEAAAATVFCAAVMSGLVIAEGRKSKLAKEAESDEE